MIKVFSNENADRVWLAAIKNLETSKESLQVSRRGNTKELLHCCFEIKDPRQRIVFSRTPIINPAFLIAEVFWILAGRNDSKFLNFWNSQLPKFAGTDSEYHGAYGYRLRKLNGIDQLYQAYTAFKNNPATRQVVLQIWYSELDLPEQNGMPKAPDIPCNLISILKLRNDKLEWTQIMRSNDIYLGTPHNFFQFTCLQEIIAGWLEVDVGNYIHVSDSLHYYVHDTTKFSYKERNFPKNEDDLRLKYSEFHDVLNICCVVMDLIIEPELTEAKLKLACNVDVPKQYKNLLLICIAESARRRKLPAISKFAMAQCSNKMYSYLWECWLEKINLKKGY